MHFKSDYLTWERKSNSHPPNLLLRSCVTHSGGKKGKTSPINIIQTSMSRLFCASNSLCQDSLLNNLIAISNILISWAWYLQLNTIKLSQVSKCNPTTSLISAQRYRLLTAHRGFSTKNHMCYSVTVWDQSFLAFHMHPWINKCALTQK